ncbi:MAG: hypothetical protein Aurels2KO_16620 [Aureliella sp.]
MIQLQLRSCSLLAAFVAFATACAINPAKSAQPDIVLIVADDLGWGDLACFGSDEVQSPALDALASEGQRWTNFYANCCVCSPTRASILTGCYPDRVGVPGVIRTNASNSWGKLKSGVAMLPALLQQAGYQTAAIGKWHLGLTTQDHPVRRGFDHFHGFLGDMMDDYYDHRRQTNNYMRLGDTPINPSGHATHLFENWAKLAIDKMETQDAPYFLYLAFNAPHTPIQPPSSALDNVRKRLPGVSDKRAKLIALIEDMDASIGRVLERVKQTQRETLIIFVSDNGGQLNVGADNGPLRGGKQSKYEGGIRVPAIVKWTGKIPAGSSTDAIGVTMDLMPTICQALQLERPSSIDGKSLMPWLTNPAKAPGQREVYYVRREGGPAYCGLTIEALRKGDWKLVHNLPTEPMQLFNLAKDPYETTDLASTNRKQMREMMNTLMKHIQAAGQVPWQPAADK